MANTSFDSKLFIFEAKPIAKPWKGSTEKVEFIVVLLRVKPLHHVTYTLATHDGQSYSM